MRPIDADEAKKQIRQMQALKPSEKMLLMLALDRTPTYEPPNDPLTLEELREMDGEPVWIDDWFEDFHGWELSETASDYFEGDSRTVEAYGTRWVAYRRKPEEAAP